MTDFETAAGFVVGALFFVLIIRYALKPLSTPPKERRRRTGAARGSYTGSHVGAVRATRPRRAG